jgi:sn-glycerol 3-phosphate transport system substrate-binding protein
MRRVLFLFVSVLALLLGACAGGAEAPSETGAAGPVTITFWHSMNAANRDALEALTARFNGMQKEVKVELVFQGNYVDSLNKFIASLPTGDVPAILQMQDASTQLLIDSDQITPVQDFIDQESYDLSDFEPRILDYYRVGDRLYSMPFNVSNPVLLYDKNSFRQAGLDPEKPPQTLDELTEYSRKLMKRDNQGNVTRSGIALEISPALFEQMLANAGALYVNNGNGRDGRPTEAVFNGPEGKGIFQWWHDMVDGGLAFNVGRNPSGTDHLLAVGSGRAAMTIAYSSALRSVLNALEAGAGPAGVEPAVAPLPAPQSPNGGMIVGGASLWIIKKRPDAEQEAAWKFIKFLVEPAQQADWYAGTGYFPIRHQAYEEPAAQEVEAHYPFFRVAADHLAAGARDRATQGALLGPFPQVRDAVATAMEQMLVGSKAPDEALDEAASEATNIIQDYNRRVTH